MARRISFIKVWISVVVALLVSSTLLPAGTQSVSSRQVAEYRGKPLEVFLPIKDGIEVERVLRNVAAASGVRFGLERVVDDPLPERMRWLPRSPAKAQLSGRSLREALDWLVQEAPPLRSAAAQSLRFGWAEAGDMVLVSQVSGRVSFLDERIDSFEVRDANLPEAIAILHRHFDASYPIHPIDIAAQPGMRTRSPDDLATFTSRFTLMQRDTSARAILAALVRAAGNASWIVRYATPRCEYAGVQIVVAGPEGVTHITRARG